jgi:Lon-like protease
VRRWIVVPLILAVLAGAAIGRGLVPCGVLATQPACDVALRPGPSEDTLRLVSVTGAPSYASAGQLLLTTVAVQDGLDLREWLAARTSRIVDAVPREVVYPPGSDRDDVAEYNAALMADSQLTATVAALRALGYDLQGEGARVVAVLEDAVTDELAVGDLIIAVDGEPVTDSGEVVQQVRARRPGEQLVLGVQGPGGVVRDVAVTLGASPEAPEVPFVGVLLTTQLDLPVDVRIEAGAIGGPSAGLMFALSIVDLLGPEDLTGGAIIAGTGTLDADGVVGAVGGIRQKLAGALDGAGERRSAQVFLVPRGNLEEARTVVVDRDVLLVPVSTLAEALRALEAVRAGGDPRGAVALGPRD